MAERRRTRSVRDAGDDPDRHPQEAEEDEDFADQEDAELDGGQPAIVDEDGFDSRAGTEGASEVDADVGTDDDLLPSRGRRSGAKARQRSKRRSPSPNDAALTVREAAKAALQQIMELTAKPAESVTGVERTEDGWRIGIEVIEDRRIPSSADILATYRAEIDEDGELVSYQRVRRYPRSRGDSSEGSLYATRKSC